MFIYHRIAEFTMSLRPPSLIKDIGKVIMITAYIHTLQSEYDYIIDSPASSRINYIDVRDTEFCTFSSPKIYNWLLFRYYSYMVRWEAKPAPPEYKYWNISMKPVRFIKDCDAAARYPKLVPAKVF